MPILRQALNVEPAPIESLQPVGFQAAEVISVLQVADEEGLALGAADEVVPEEPGIDEGFEEEEGKEKAGDR